MPTSISPLTAENMIKANSGAYHLLHQDGGYTGNLNLTGPARIDNLNAGNAYVGGVLNVTGSQANFGNFTGFNFNHLARIVNTGDAYLRSVTGVATFNEVNITGRSKIDQIYDGLNISGDLGLVGDARMTGAVNITGTLFVNGQQISGLAQANQELVLTGDYASLYVNRGDILVGTGNSGAAILSTGANGYLMTVDTGSANGYSFTNPSTLVGANFLSQSSGLFGSTRSIVVRPTGGINGLSLNFDTLGTGSYIFGPMGLNTISQLRNGFVFGSGNSVGTTSQRRNTVVMGKGNTVTSEESFTIGQSNINSANGGIIIGSGNSVSANNHGVVIGSRNTNIGSGKCFGENCASTAGLSFGSSAYSTNAEQFAFAGGSFDGNVRGTAQSNIFNPKTVTNDSTASLRMNVFGGSYDFGTATIHALVSAYDSSSGGTAGYEISACFSFNSSGSGWTILGTQQKTVLGESGGASGWDANLLGDATSPYIEVSSDGSVDVKWVATCVVNQVMNYTE